MIETHVSNYQVIVLVIFTFNLFVLWDNISMMEEKEEMQWFEKLRLNSWEVEILIVGFVLVMLFNIPDSLSLELSKMEAGLVGRGVQDFLVWFVIFMTLLIISTIVNILIVSFSLYLGLRGFWVGVLGLSSVFPMVLILRN